jgi:hypothetical protein
MNEVIKKTGVTFGIILAVLSVLVTAIFYAVDLKLFTNYWIGTLLLIVNLGILIMSVYTAKKALNGVITFKEAFTVYFITVVIGLTASTLFNLLLFNAIDPGAKVTIKELTIKASVQMMERFNAPAEVLDKQIEELETMDQYSPESLVKGWFIGIVISSLLGLLLALIFRTKPDYKV